MSKQYNVNTLPANSAAITYTLKQLMVTAGWVVKSSGDGLSAFSSTGDIITSGSSGANGFNNSKAWFRIQDPATVREFLFQRGSAGVATLYIQYSALAKFTGGSPSAIVTPTATDAVNCWSTSNSGGTFWQGTGMVEGAVYAQCMADSSAPYTFYMFGYSTGGSGTRGLFFMDSLQSGSYNASDQDPIVIGALAGIAGAANTNIFNGSSTSTMMKGGQTAGSAGVFGWIKFNIAGATWVSLAVNPVMDDSNIMIPGGLPTNAYNSQDEVFAPSVGNYSGRSAPQGFKGYLSNLRAIGPQRAISADTLTITTAKDYIIVEKSWALPWNGSTPSN